MDDIELHALATLVDAERTMFHSDDCMVTWPALAELEKELIRRKILGNKPEQEKK